MKRTENNLDEIHAIATALAGMTKGQADINAVAAQYLNGVLIPEGETPASHLVNLQNQLDQFLDELIEQVWSRQDFIDNDVDPDQIEGGREQ